MPQFMLTKIEICGFRGITKRQEITPGAPLTLIYGGNRQGKSSITNAVEWCLFGPEVAQIQYGQIRERDGWEVKNPNSPSCWVQCELQSPDGTTITAKRTYKTPRTSEFYFQVGKDDKSEDEKKLHAFLRISSSDFFSSVHLHPETVRSLVIAKPKDRKEAIDRLLGLSELRDMENAFKAQRPNDWTTELDNELNVFDVMLTTAFMEKKKIIDNESAELLSNGFAQSDLTVEGAQRYAGKIAADMQRFASQYRLPTPNLIEPTDLAGVQKIRNELPAAIQKLRTEHPILADQGKYLIRKNEFEGLRSSYVSQHQALTGAETALTSFPEKRSLEQITADLAALGAEIAKTTTEMREVVKNASVLDHALVFFQDRLDGDRLACPLCGETKRTVAEWRSHIQQEIRSKDLGPLQARRQEMDKQHAALENAKAQKLALEKKVSGEKAGLSSNVEYIQKRIGKTILSTDDPVSVLNAEIASVEAAVSGLQQQVAEIHANLEGFNQAVHLLDRFLRIGRVQQEITKIGAISDCAAYKELKNIRSQCEQYAEDVQLLIEGLNNAVTAEAELRLVSVRKSISDTFLKITDRPDFPGLKVSPEGDGYKIELTSKMGASRTAVPILNHADINCAAISIFLALAGSTQISHRLGFVILDDPSQSLDAGCKKNLCSVLADLCNSRQVIVATADDDLKAEVDQMTKIKTSYTVNDWTPTGGPIIKSQQAAAAANAN